MATFNYTFSCPWTDWPQNTYTVSVGNPSMPVVVLLHGAGGNSSDFTNLRPVEFPFDFNSSLPGQRDLGWNGYPAVGLYSVELDPRRPNVQGWVPFLLKNGFSTVDYSQVDNQGLVARPVEELGLLIDNLLSTGLTSSGLPATAPLLFLAHSRGCLIARKFLKDHAADPVLHGRIHRVVLLAGPNQGSEWGNVVLAAENTALGLAEAAIGALGAPLLADALGTLFGAWMQGQDFEEMQVGSTFLADLANGEAAFPGATYYTFGGTNITYTRVRWWWFTPGSALPQWHWPPFDWQVDCSQVPGISPVLDTLPHPIPEVTPGLGDMMVADARAHLPFSTPQTMQLNHAQWLYDPSLQADVLKILTN
jgi:pimeloyl-ACP methyl ester carboxylesterase